MRTPQRRTALRRDFQRPLLLLAGLVAAVALLVKLSDVVLMAFAAILVAVMLQAVAEPLQQRARLSRTLALGVAVALITAVLAVSLWGFGRQVEAQFAALAELVPGAWRELKIRLNETLLGAALLREVEDFSGAGWLLQTGSRLAAAAAATAAGAVIVLFAGLYLAFHPRSYVEGALLLFPRRHRARVQEVLEACHIALRQWLLGQAFSMLLVGFTTGLGLALVGAPSAVALGVIAGAGQFVPVVGPMAAVLPGLLVSLADGPETFFWTAAVYVAASQLEANLITPLLLRQLAQLPMAVSLFAVLAMGVLLGPLGVLLATPLAVVTYVLVKMLYVEGVLGETPAGLTVESRVRLAE